MREIKFRAWDKHSKMWIGIPIRREGKNKIFTRIIQETPNIEIMQFTGLKDKNGKEIFEGDIVKIFHFKSKKQAKDEGLEFNYYYGLVKFGEFNDEGETSWGYGWYFEDYPVEKEEKKWKGKTNTTILTENRFEVIGNKFENPELLK